jgi:hypothetical protein
MAGVGPPPKDPSKRRRRNADGKDSTTVAADRKVRGFALPAGALPDGEQWHSRTRAWWETWRKSPQSQAFVSTDWDFLLDTAVMHHAMWSKGRWDFAAELRLRVAKFGATVEDRARLKMTIETPPAERPASTKEASVTDISSRRKRLTG